jgi:hypothetical protein
MKIAPLALGTALLAACSAGAPPEAPADSALRFRCAGPLDVRFLEMRADGAFQFYSRAHFTTARGLAGTWTRSGPDALSLRCERWSRQVVCGSLRVRLGSAWEGQRPRIREAVAAFLAKHPDRPDFSREELEDVGCWEEEREVPAGRALVTVVPIAALDERAPRVEVERLLPALDAYGRGEDPHVVHARLHRHRGLEFLEWLDWSAYGDPVSLDAVKASLDRLAPGEQPSGVWTALGAREFDVELWRGDRFRYFK